MEAHVFTSSLPFLPAKVTLFSGLRKLQDKKKLGGGCERLPYSSNIIKVYMKMAASYSIEFGTTTKFIS